MPALANVSGGQVVAEPLHTSALSHAPAEARHGVPAKAGPAETHAGIPPLHSNFGYGMGDYFGLKELWTDWRAKGDLKGLELEK